jgi:hypothetical protein
MFIIPHLIFLCLYSYAVERYGSYVEYNSIHPDFFLPVFVFLLSKSPYAHLVILVSIVGCFADIIQGNNWSQLTCLYVLVYLGMDRLRIAQKCSNYFAYSATIIGISILQPIWLRTTGVFHAEGEPMEHILFNFVFASLTYFIFRLIRLGWGIPKQQLAHRPIHG